MSIDEMINHSMMDYWYNIVTPEGVYNVMFHLIDKMYPTYEEGKIKKFNIIGLRSIPEEVKVIHDMILYAAKHQQEKIYFENDFFLFLVTIDVLETYD